VTSSSAFRRTLESDKYPLTVLLKDSTTGSKHEVIQTSELKLIPYKTLYLNTGISDKKLVWLPMITLFMNYLTLEGR